MYDHTLFISSLKNHHTRHVNLAVSLVIADGHLVFSRSLCEYAQVRAKFMSIHLEMELVDIWQLL